MPKQEKVVYFCGAIRGDRTMLKTMKEIVRYIKEDLNIPVLSEHVVADDTNAFRAEKAGISEEDITVEYIEQTDIAWLDRATHVIAEISCASTGVGREFEYARMKGQFGKTPALILCVYHKDREHSATAMIRGMTKDRYPNVSVNLYESTDDVKQLVRNFLA